MGKSIEGSLKHNPLLQSSLAGRPVRELEIELNDARVYDLINHHQIRAQFTKDIAVVGHCGSDTNIYFAPFTEAPKEGEPEDALLRICAGKSRRREADSEPDQIIGYLCAGRVMIYNKDESGKVSLVEVKLT